jgi:predicted transcriptional regulator of viral defense system
MRKAPVSEIAALPAGIYRTRELEARGFSRVHVRRMAERGELVQEGRGLYSTANIIYSAEHTFAEVSKRVPKGVVCLTSALQLHQLTTQSPWQVCLLLPRGYHAPMLSYPTLWVFRVSMDALTDGVEVRTIEGTEVRVTSIARTVADCFKFRGRIGLDVALEALRESLSSNRATVDDLIKYGRLCRVETVMRPYLEAMLEVLHK